MKIALQLASLISTAKSSAPSVTAGAPDFQSTFTAAVASSSTRSNKSTQPEEAKKKTAPQLQSDVTIQTPVQAPPAKIIAPIVTQQIETASTQLSSQGIENLGEGSFQTNSTFPESNLQSTSASSLLAAMEMPIGGMAGSGSEATIQAPPAGTEVAMAITPTGSIPPAGGTPNSKRESVLSSVSTPEDALQSNAGVDAFELPATSKLAAPPSGEVLAKGKTDVKSGDSSQSPLRAVKEHPKGNAKDLASPDRVSVKPESGRTSDGDVSKRPNEGSAKDSGRNAEGIPTAQPTTMLQSNLTFASCAPLNSSNSGLQATLSSNGTKASGGTSSFLTKDAATSKTASSKGETPNDEGFKSSGDAEIDGSTQIAPATMPLSGKLAEPVGVANSVPSAPQDPAGAAVTAQLVQSDAGPSHVQPAAQSNSAVHTAAVQVQTPSAAASASVETMPSLSSAQLVQSMHHSEMRLGMQSEEFGNISISTSLNHQAISAQISMDHSELSRALAAHLPSIEEKLGNAYGVQARVEVRDAASNNTSSYSNSGQQSKEERQSRGGTSAGSTVVAVDRMSALTTVATNSVAASSSRLDIRI